MARAYKQFCGVAVALDRVGERWTLLIVRNLLAGAARYGDLFRDLPGITTNLLAKRLKDMQANGLVTKRRLPSPASANVYEITPDGAALEPMLMALGGWGARFLGPDLHDYTFNLRYALVSLKRGYTPVVPPEGPSSRWAVQLTTGDRAFWMLLGGSEVELNTLYVGNADVVCHADAEMDLIAWLKGRRDLQDLTVSGQLCVEGSPRAIRALKAAFQLV